MEMNIPKLRFRKDDGTHYPKWQEKKIKDFSQKIGDGLHGTPIYDLNSDYHFVNGNNIKNGKLVLYNSDKRVSPAIAKKNDKDLDSDTILISLNGTIGNLSIYENQKVMLGKSIGYIKTKDINRVFLMYLLSSNTVQTKFNKSVTGTTIKNLGLAEIREMKVTTPSLSEQDKIADFLSTIDLRITNQSNKVVSLTELKKGIMQKLFSQEIRFKREDGGEYPKWDALLLVNLIKKKFKGVLPRVIKDGNILLNNDFLDNNAEPILVDNNINVSEEDVLILWDGSQSGRAYTGFKGVLGSTLIGLALKKDIADNRFIQKYLEFKLDTIQTTWRTGSGVPHVTKEFVEKFIIPVPSIKEQQKIADFLSTLDSKIDIETQILSTLQTLKKGLLQQMFV